MKQNDHVLLVIWENKTAASVMEAAVFAYLVKSNTISNSS